MWVWVWVNWPPRLSYMRCVHSHPPSQHIGRKNAPKPRRCQSEIQKLGYVDSIYFSVAQPHRVGKRPKAVPHKNMALSQQRKYKWNPERTRSKNIHKPKHNQGNKKSNNHCLFQFPIRLSNFSQARRCKPKIIPRRGGIFFRSSRSGHITAKFRRVRPSPLYAERAPSRPPQHSVCRLSRATPFHKRTLFCIEELF